MALLSRLRAIAAERPDLYPVTRVLVDPPNPLPNPRGGRHWSGVEVAGGWAEFLGSAVPVFDAHEYERGRRWQQVGYYGEPHWMNEYTRLAGQAWGLLPAAFAVPKEFRGRQHVNRDVWTFAVYHIADRCRRANADDPFGLDIYGQAPYSEVAFTGLEVVTTSPTCDPEHHEHHKTEEFLTRFRRDYEAQIGRKPDFVFATLRIDVFTATLLAVRHLIAHRAELYGDPDRFFALVGEGTSESPRTSDCIVPETPKGSVFGDQSKPGGDNRNDARDEWLYRKCMDKSILLREIVRELGEVYKENRWSKISTEQGVQAAARRFAERKGLPPLPGRKDDDLF